MDAVLRAVPGVLPAGLGWRIGYVGDAGTSDGGEAELRVVHVSARELRDGVVETTEEVLGYLGVIGWVVDIVDVDDANQGVFGHREPPWGS